MFAPTAYDWSDKRVAYDALVRDLAALLHGEPDLVANASQTVEASLVFCYVGVPNVEASGFVWFKKEHDAFVKPRP